MDWKVWSYSGQVASDDCPKKRRCQSLGIDRSVILARLPIVKRRDDHAWE